MVKIYCIAGEASGDFIGACLMKALQAQKKGSDAIIIRGIGGLQMCAQGLDLFFGCDQIAVMGLLEVLPHIFRIKKLIRRTIKDIITFQPDVVVTIDSAGFCNRVIDGVKKQRSSFKKMPKFVHYVAPMVWAWKPKRAQVLAKRIDHLLCLFDFEPSYFTCHGLEATHVGHPLIELNWDRSVPANPLSHEPHLCVLAGSREAELKRHLPIFKEALKNFKGHISFVTFDRYGELILSFFADASLITNVSQKYEVFKRADMALAVSGTVALELVLAKTPTLVAYKANALTAFFAKRLIHLKWVSLPNIILNKELVPEMIQEKCNSTSLRQALQKPEDTFKNQGVSSLQAVYDALMGGSAGDISTVAQLNPSEKASQIILRMCENEI